MDRWKQRMIDGYSRVVSVNEIFSSYMQGDVRFQPGQIDTIVQKIQPQLTRTANAIKRQKIERTMYPKFVEYVQKIAEELPGSNRPIFVDTSGITFTRLHPTDHDSRPDVSASLPGSHKAPKKWEWHHVGTVIEFKLDDDPFDGDGHVKFGQLENLVQLLKNARCILMASAACFVFVVSVFRNNACLFRVDRSGYTVSHTFDWSRNVRVFPEFYWRLYNGVKKRLLGHDSTVSTPTPAEKKKMFKELIKLPQYASMSLEDATTRSRWVDVKFHGGDRRAFTVGSPIFQLKGLFGRGTRVERVLIEGQKPLQMYAMKDAWRQACRRPESHYYEVIQDYAEEHYEGKMKGLARCVGSVDLSVLYDDHRTITAKLRVDGNSLLDRCHDRSLFTPVGFTLDRFQSTKQLVQALRSAIAGHEFALLAGVLHRDISAGNVLIDEDDPASPDAGFVLDFNYSTFTDDGLRRFGKLYPNFEMEEVDKDLKDLTGTFPFMSVPALEQMLVAATQDVELDTGFTHSSKHDLESFYWLLIWLLRVLRHTNHRHLHGATACSRVFDGEAAQVLDTKSGWLAYLGHRARLPIPNNAPLTTLVDTLTIMFRNQNQDRESGAPVTHETLLAAFDTAIESPGWPENDAAEVFVAPLTNCDLPPPVVEGAESQRSWNSAREYWRTMVKTAVPVPEALPASGPRVRGRGPTAGPSGSSGQKRTRSREEGRTTGGQDKSKKRRTRQSTKSTI
ncbi:hypothetical protein C8R46DRAFT_1153485 [Mycena filopes]|nr:hypothetical protein C8R46DRAFT_1153485 [Mycena filopes]